MIWVQQMFGKSSKKQEMILKKKGSKGNLIRERGLYFLGSKRQPRLRSWELMVFQIMTKMIRIGNC